MTDILRSKKLFRPSISLALAVTADAAATVPALKLCWRGLESRPHGLQIPPTTAHHLPLYTFSFDFVRCFSDIFNGQIIQIDNGRRRDECTTRFDYLVVATILWFRFYLFLWNRYNTTSALQQTHTHTHTYSLDHSHNWCTYLPGSYIWVHDIGPWFGCSHCRFDSLVVSVFTF